MGKMKPGEAKTRNKGASQKQNQNEIGPVDTETTQGQQGSVENRSLIDRFTSLRTIDHLQYGEK